MRLGAAWDVSMISGWVGICIELNMTKLQVIKLVMMVAFRDALFSNDVVDMGEREREREQYSATSVLL